MSNSILFLDIDGVLIINNCKAFDSDCVERLYNIIATTGCKIVLSSTWRIGGLDTFFNFIRSACIQHPFRGDVICDATIGSTTTEIKGRSLEIQEWDK